MILERQHYFFSFLAASLSNRRSLIDVVDGDVEGGENVGVLLLIAKMSSLFRVQPNFSRCSSTVVNVANVLAKKPYLKNGGMDG